MWIAEVIVWALSVYALVGLLAALRFFFKTGGTTGFRFIILPGVAALWPLLFTERGLR